MKQRIKKLGLIGFSAVAMTMLIGAGTASACSMDEWNSDNHSDTSSWREETSQQANGETIGHHGHGARQELRRKLDAALREHAAVGVAALKAELLQEPDAAALNGLVGQNSAAIADLIGAAYPGTQEEFLELWQSHLAYYKEYLTAAAAQDEDGKEQAKEKLAAFTYELSDLLAHASGRLDAEALQASLAVHGEQVTTIIDEFIAGDYEAAWATAHEAYEHMGMLAELLADGRPGRNHMQSMQS